MDKKYKEEGNQAFKEKKYHTAIKLYTKSLAEHQDPIVFGNRAQAELNAKLYLLALVDTEKAIQMDQTIAKNFYRRALACQNLGLFEQARSDAQKCFKLSKDQTAEKLTAALAGKKNETIMSVAAIERDEFLTTDEVFIDVAIESGDVAVSPSTSDHVIEETMKIPGPPANFGDFTTAYRYLESKPEMFAQYFWKIDPSVYKSLFDDLLEPSMVSLLLKGIAKLLDSAENIGDVAAKLLGLADVHRFDLVVMMLGLEDREYLAKISAFLEPADAILLENKYS